MRILGGSASRRSPRTSLFAMRPFPAREGTMAREKTRSNFRAVAKRIIEDHRSFDPTGSAASGLHRFDGILPDYSAVSLSRYTSRARKDLKALDRIAQTDGLSRAARLELGVLRGLLLSELSEIDDQRLPRAFPFYFLYRLSIVNYLLREYAPLDRRKYERMIFAEHLARIPLERLLEVGRSDMKANQAAFRETAKKIDSSKAPKEALEDMEQDHPTEQNLIEDTRGMLEEIRQYVIEHDIVTVPSEERAKVIETPRFYRFATAAMNPPGSFERAAKDAFYYVTPVEESWTPEKREEWLRHLNYTTLRNISVHECYPGHYVHFLHRMKIPSTALRSYTSYAFTEGWAHYCEWMMVQEGYGDPRLRIAMFQDALLRDCRYLSSIGMHTGSWSWEDATRFFMKNAYLDRLPAEREAKRGTWDPGYLNYTLGKLMIRKLRADWEKQHPKAALKEFHDAFLALGAPPLGLAREHLLGRNAGPAL